MRRLFTLALALGFVGSLGAQKAPFTIETKTIELKHMRPEDAISLLKPYLVNGGGSVTGVANLPIVTIRDISDNIPKMEKVLAKYDHSPATIRLVFQLIEADTGPRIMNTVGGRPVTMDLDATLRSVLRFSSYRLLAQSLATSGENSVLYQKLADADTVGWRYTYDIRAVVGPIRLSDATLQTQSAAVRTVSSGQLEVDTMAIGTVRLNVELLKRTEVASQPVQSVIETGLDVPLDHTVVLGTATSAKTGFAIILTVKPELVRIK